MEISESKRAAWGPLAHVATPKNIALWMSWPAGKFKTYYNHLVPKGSRANKKQPLKTYKVRVSEVFKCTKDTEIDVLAKSREDAMCNALNTVKGKIDYAEVISWSSLSEPKFYSHSSQIIKEL